MKSSLIAVLPLLSGGASAFCPAETHRKVPVTVRSSIPRHIDEVASESCQAEASVGDSRRAFLTFAAASLGFTATYPGVSHARYGEDAKIIIPDVVQEMADRNNKQCLVESLGNRACLVYLDPENQLYKGTDAKVLFERLGSSFSALKDLPIYIESKQWNKVIGVMTGPMGTLSFTMNELVKIANGDSSLKKLSVDIRNDLYAIAGAADRKNVKDAMAAYERAEVKLEKFVTLVSSG